MRSSMSWLVAAALIAFTPADRPMLVLPVRAAQSAPARLTCTTLLTDDQLATVAGATFTPGDQRVFDDGESLCSWTRESVLGGLTTLGLDFRDLATIRGIDRSALAATGTPWPATLAQFFDHVVKFTSTNVQAAPEPVTGIGERATFIPGAMSHLVVQRRDGVAHLNGINLAKDRLLALGRIVASR